MLAAAAVCLPGADFAPERIELPEIACSAPDGAPFAFPRIGHDRHAVIVVEPAGCSGTLLAGEEVVGKVRDEGPGQRFDFSEQLRRAEAPVLRFRPAEAGYGEVRMRLEITPRIYFYGLKAAGGVVTFTARNTLDNTADLFFRVEAGGGLGGRAVSGTGGGAGDRAAGAAAGGTGGGAGGKTSEQAENLGPNSERDYRFEMPGLRRGEMVRVVMEKAGEALEGGYRFVDGVRVQK